MMDSMYLNIGDQKGRGGLRSPIANHSVIDKLFFDTFRSGQ